MTGLLTYLYMGLATFTVMFIMLWQDVRRGRPEAQEVLDHGIFFVVLTILLWPIALYVILHEMAKS